MAARALFRAALRARLPFLPARAVRAGVAALALAAAACGGDSTGPRGGNGTFELARVEGQDIPVTGDIQGTSVTINGGTLQLDDDAYTLTLQLRANGRDQSATDEGTLERDEADLAFTSTSFGDRFRGQLSDNNRTLAIEYDLTGDGNITTFEFERR